MNRFISIIESPGRVWTDYLVVDTVKCVVVCECSDSRNADEIAACLNLQHVERSAKQLAEELPPWM